MKTTVKAFAFAIMACVALVSLNSCSSSSDPDPTAGDKAPTKATVDPAYYVNAKVLKYFTVEVTDVNGNTVQLDENNTTEVATFPAASGIANTINSYLTGNNEKLRMYKGTRVELSSFPTSATASIKVTARDNVQMPDNEKMGIVAAPFFAVDNNGSGSKQWGQRHENMTLSLSTFSGSGWWSKYVERRGISTYSVKYDFSSAASYDGSGITVTSQGKTQQ